MSSLISNVRPQPDKVLTNIADYVLNYKTTATSPGKTAHYCLLALSVCVWML